MNRKQLMAAAELQKAADAKRADRAEVERRRKELEAEEARLNSELRKLERLQGRHLRLGDLLDAVKLIQEERQVYDRLSDHDRACLRSLFVRKTENDRLTRMKDDKPVLTKIGQACKWAVEAGGVDQFIAAVNELVREIETQQGKLL